MITWTRGTTGLQVLLRSSSSTSYEIFDLLFADVTKKFRSDNRIFTYKYVVGKQRIRIHILKQETKDIDPVDILNLLNQLQQNYGYHSNWGCFYFNCFNLSDQNITIFEFLVQNKEEIRMFQHFCDLAISWTNFCSSGKS